MVKIEKVIEYGVYLFIFLLPWQTRLIWRDFLINGFTMEYGRLSLYGTEILLLAVLSIYGFWLLKNKKLQQVSFGNFLTQLQNPVKLIYWLSVVFVLWCGLTIFWSIDGQLAYYTWLKLLAAVAFFSMLVVFPFEWERIATAWVGSAIIQSILAIWQFFVQVIPANKWFGLAYHLPTIGGATILQTSDARWLRAYGGLPHPNILAGFLLIALIFLIYLAFKEKSIQQRIFVLTGLIFITPALFFSFSRSAWLALIIVVIALIPWVLFKGQGYWKKYFVKITFLIMIITAVLTVNLFEEVGTRLAGIEPLEVNSIELRFTFTEQAVVLIKNSFFTGVGLGNYTLGIFNQLNNSWPGYYYQPVHNIFLLAFAEIGIIGFLLLVAILGLLFKELIKSLDQLEVATALMMLVAMVVVSLFDHYFWSMYFGVVAWWFVLGLALRQLAKK